jgi:hypothetical protein
MLPVITANICGSNGVHKPGNILFDSGAQISLIRRETANSLRLPAWARYNCEYRKGWRRRRRNSNKSVQSECDWNRW